MDDLQFKRLLEYFEFSWQGYRKVRKGVKKRIARHMQQRGCRNLEAYLALLAFNEDQRRECEKRMTVSISRFFRDKQLWLGLEQEILPRLIRSQNETVTIWSAGCARGEEVYSFLIVWDRLKKVCDPLPKLAVTATDMVAEYLDKAKIGVYGVASFKELSAENRNLYFETKKGGKRFAIKPRFKADIQWNVRHLFEGPPATGYHIIFLRNNLLTYYQEHLKIKVFKKIAAGLLPGGWLIVGSHEKLPENAADFIQHDSIPWAYCQKKTSPVI
jgi:chemotaxis methyl-accepting protein methylase